MSNWRAKIIRSSSKAGKKKSNELDRLREYLKALKSRFPDVESQVDQLQDAVKDERKLNTFFTTLSKRRPDGAMEYAKQRVREREHSMLSPHMAKILQRARNRQFSQRLSRNTTPRTRKRNIQRVREQWRSNHNEKL
jgi:hypothetical protein